MISGSTSTGFVADRRRGVLQPLSQVERLSVMQLMYDVSIEEVNVCAWTKEPKCYLHVLRIVLLVGSCSLWWGRYVWKKQPNHKLLIP